MGDGDSVDSTDPTDRSIEGHQNRAKPRWRLVGEKPQQTAQSMRRLKELHDKTDAIADVAYEARSQHIRLCELSLAFSKDRTLMSDATVDELFRLIKS